MLIPPRCSLSLHCRTRRPLPVLWNSAALAPCACGLCSPLLECMSRGVPSAPSPTNRGEKQTSRLCFALSSSAGRVLDLEVVAGGQLPWKPSRASPSTTATATHDGPLEWVSVRPLSAGIGLLEFEVQRGAMLSPAVPVLAVPSEAAAGEVVRLQRALAGACHHLRPSSAELLPIFC